jgi:hypothetical protein
MHLAVRFPTVSHDPVKAMIAVVYVRDEAPQVCSRFPADAVLDVLIALGPRETVRAVSWDPCGDGRQEQTTFSSAVDRLGPGERYLSDVIL